MTGARLLFQMTRISVLVLQFAFPIECAQLPTKNDHGVSSSWVAQLASRRLPVCVNGDIVISCAFVFAVSLAPSQFTFIDSLLRSKKVKCNERDLLQLMMVAAITSAGLSPAGTASAWESSRGKT